MHIRFAALVFGGVVLVLSGVAATLVAKILIEPKLGLSANPKAESIILSGSFSEPYKICILPPYSSCGNFCTVSEGNIFIRATLRDTLVWKVKLDSTVQIFEPSYREVRYYSEGICIKKSALEEFELKVISVKDLGADIESVIGLGG